MTSALGLNDHHQATVINYMRFARYQRGQRLRAVDACFDDLKDSRLIDETFTVDEVTEMLDGLLAVVRGEMESELINTAHTNVLLLRQLCQQAEKWHLKLQADISELENRDLLEKIKDFEDAEFTGTKRDTDFSALSGPSKLEPLNESSASALLHMEIERLKEENEKLKDRLKAVESQALGIQQEKNLLSSDLEKTKNALSSAKGTVIRQDSGEEVEALRKQMAGLKSEIDKSRKHGSAAAEMLEGDLADTKHELLKVRADLELAEKELEKKVSQTAPFKNLKQMLTKKNDQIKDLRRRLAKYEDSDL
ncbi:leucine zipper transcription factor-like protein 1 isoform X3 [Lingula anatina]|uniref:Leucine zipper transcription factor-like protein 1 n=1 Tax=Lingula anatina TaxID=7574 RepID=A0A1S3INS5_LINAN|nr:leucine zipper transcription factor-like protein 1 isoform X3 [Lingula anatina]|eukprot:XP_013399551.1 leucine zipper transcription factor-like protein 1 isoform X3 [Lingula anatina]